MGLDVTLRALTLDCDTSLGEGEVVLRTWCVLSGEEPERYSVGLGFKEECKSHVPGFKNCKTS